METYFRLLEEFPLFLHDWQLHLPSTAFAGLIWVIIVIHLLITGHATLGSNGDSDDIGCGDSRVWRIFFIFGGPSGLSFGLPYFWLMNILGFTGIVKEYWIGFIYIQFVTSVLQTIIFLLFCLFGQRSVKPFRLFKSHLKGCGWVSGLSPIGWILYWIQQLSPDSIKWLMWLPRDIETLLVFIFTFVASPLLLICLVGSIFNQRLIIPFITWIDQDHKEDEDSSIK